MGVGGINDNSYVTNTFYPDSSGYWFHFGPTEDPGYPFMLSPPYNTSYVIWTYNITPDYGAQTESNGYGDFAAAEAQMIPGFINCTNIEVDGSKFSPIQSNSVYCVYYYNNNGKSSWYLSSPYSSILDGYAISFCNKYVINEGSQSAPEGAFLCANGTVDGYSALPYSGCSGLSSSSPDLTNCYWFNGYSGPTIGGSPCSGGMCIGGGSLTLAPVTTAICNVYTIVNSALFILALIIMLLGGTLYAGGHFLPSQTRGIVQGYAMGMIIGGVVAVIIAMVAPWILSIVTNTPITSIVSVCSATT